MHVQIRSDNGELLGDLHISREAQACTILYSEMDTLDELVAIASAQNVPYVTIMVPKAVIPDMESLGWRLHDSLIVMYKKR